MELGRLHRSINLLIISLESWVVREVSCDFSAFLHHFLSKFNAVVLWTAGIQDSRKQVSMNASQSTKLRQNVRLVIWPHSERQARSGLVSGLKIPLASQRLVFVFPFWRQTVVVAALWRLSDDIGCPSVCRGSCCISTVIWWTLVLDILTWTDRKIEQGCRWREVVGWWCLWVKRPSQTNAQIWKLLYKIGIFFSNKLSKIWGSQVWKGRTVMSLKWTWNKSRKGTANLSQMDPNFEVSRNGKRITLPDGVTRVPTDEYGLYISVLWGCLA